MADRNAAVTMHGNPLTLTGDPKGVGDKLPDAQVLDNGLGPVSIAGLFGKVLILSTVPSLDTSVCSLQAKRFDGEAGKLGDKVQVVTVSMDLPFAQKRWADEAGVKNNLLLSDHLTAEFGLKSGLLINELRLLARSVMVIDKAGFIRYMELVKEISNEPDYDAALEAAQKLV